MRIGVLGGAFDPPHAAHAALAIAARTQLNLDLVLWVPTFAPPHKDGPAASFAHRLAMTRALAAGDAAGAVSDIEASLPQPSYTLLTLRALKPLYPGNHSWHLILGADNWAGFSRWHQPEAVLAEASPAIYPRPGFPAAPSSDGVMLNFPEMTDQSTEFRDALAAGGDRRDEALARLPEAVAAYIREYDLYAPARESVA
ncbi:MAG: nicotinate (nicotinamide) nucleotide adenylyltransferase [Fibrobacteria bacterium]|jgi:nicotinate-nucleotide adenylyltransferase|nr:nicotinate (nicotinamide) nucleotide adenylyltransferase [Fibrobacteria bacterium]